MISLNEVREGKKHKQSRFKHLQSYAYLAPILVVSGVFIYYCIGFTAYASFTDWDGISEVMNFVGLKNYIELFKSPRFWLSIKNNLIFMVATVVIQAALGMIIAVILKEKLRGSNGFKALFFLPISMAPVIIAAIFRIILDPNVGSLNQGLNKIGLGFLAQTWLGDPKWALISIIAVNIFQWMGFSMITYYAGLMSIPDEVYEAADMDGASFWQKFFRVTVPMLKGTTTVLFVLGIVGSLKTFDIVMLLTRGGPGYSTEFLNTYLYKTGIEQFNGGLSAAIGVMVLVIAFVLSIIQLKVSKKDY